MGPPSPKKNKSKNAVKSPTKRKTKVRAKSWSDEATTKLIDFVEANAVLWSVEIKEYLTGKDKRNDLWVKIGKELNHTGEEAKLQWFNLRKNFKKKLVALPSGSETPKQSARWPWWDNMQFAEDAVKTNKTKSSLDDASEDDTTLNKNKLGTEQEENIGMYSRDVRTPDSPRRMLHSDEEELEVEARGGPPSVMSVISLPSSKHCSSGKKKGKHSDRAAIDASVPAIDEVNQRLKSTDNQILALLGSKKELSEEDKFGYYVSTILINESKEDREELKRRIRDTIRKFGADQLNPPANLILPMGGGYNQGYQQQSYHTPNYTLDADGRYTSL